MSGDTLFDVPESLSPRLAWMRKHGIQTLKRDDLPCEAGRWEAYVGDYEAAVTKTINDSDARFYPDESPHLAWGQTEEEAVMELAQNNEWPLWNEEGP